MNKFIHVLQEENNYTLTENMAGTYRSTMSGLMDLFALGGAYRTRSDIDCINLFKKAFEEDETYAMKCLFYLRDARGGQGERRFFRVICKWLAAVHPDAIARNLEHIAFYGRWDDLYAFADTRLENSAFAFMRKQLELDVQCKVPSLLAKWLKSENTSSQESNRLGNKTRQYLGLSHREYRKLLSSLRKKINVLERLMSENRWDEIEFDKIPSKAGMIYRNAFARHDVERMKTKGIQSYADFARDTKTKVNAKTLYPYEVVNKALKRHLDDTERLMINKYWDNLTDYFNKCSFNGIAVVDTSGSMVGTPLEVALSLGMYCAEHNTGPFANHFFTFSASPRFVTVEGVDFVDKIQRMSCADWGMNTNVEAVFDKMLEIARAYHLSQDELPQNVIIISDMEFDACACGGPINSDRWRRSYDTHSVDETLFETIEKCWNAAGYKMPTLTFWNVNARHDNIPMRPTKYVNFVSGFSPVLFEQILKGVTAYDLIMDKLNDKRYAVIQ